MKYIYILLLSLLTTSLISGCNDNDDEIASGSVLTVRNTQRVKSITGTTDKWGEFTMNFKYRGEKLDSAFVYSTDGILKAFIAVSYGGYNVLQVYDMVPVEEPKEGENQNEIERIKQLSYSKQVALNGEGYHTQIEETFYGFKENTSGYDYRYEEKAKKRFLFEFKDGKPYICRIPEPLEKRVYTFDGDMLTTIVINGFIDNDWKAIGQESYLYKDNQLQSGVISQEGEDKEKWDCSWQQNSLQKLTITDINNAEHSQVTKYTYDANGYVTNMSGESAVFNITYEQGHGNASIFADTESLLKGLPIIK